MEYLIAALILICAVPLGYILRFYAKDELRPGKKYFRLIWISGIALSFVVLAINFTDANIKKTLIFSLIFISIVSFISWK